MAYFRKVSVTALLCVALLVLNQPNEVLGDSCSFTVRMKQTLEKEGFHRNITYNIMFHNNKKSEKWTQQDCIIALDQRLPAGVYVNPDELGDFRRSNKLNAIPKNRINIELPTEQSDPSSVYIVGMVAENSVLLWLPVHARYHKAVPGGGNATNKIGSPKLYLRCPDKKLDSCGKDIPPTVTFLCNGSRGKCSWKEMPYILMTSTLVWDVPVGNLDHYYPVAFGTTLAIAIGSIYLLKAVHSYKLETTRRVPDKKKSH